MSDEELEFEAREICALVAEELFDDDVAREYRQGLNDDDAAMIAAIAALQRARDGK